MSSEYLDLTWHEQAACAGMDTNKFYLPTTDSGPGGNQKYEHEKEIRAACDSCPVAMQCLDHALRYEHHGWFANTTNKDRRELRRKLNIICEDPGYAAGAR